MATALVGGLVAAGTITSTTAIVLAAGTAMALDYAMMDNMSPEAPKMPTVTSTIDKTSLEKEAKIGDLQLGEEAKKKAKRKRGKAAFKVDLDNSTESTSDIGLSLPKAGTGVQL